MFGLFVIEAGSEPRAVLDERGKPLVYQTGQDAALHAAAFARGEMYYNGYRELKCQPRRLADDAWKAREMGRFADGTYTALPWADLPKLTLTADHFAHVSTEDGAKIAYTQDASKGAGDIQTRVKPGKYLQQFYGDTFDAPTIARMAAEFSVQFGESLELLFADTQEEIERVYVNGPRSCMAYSAKHFDSSIHPCRVYAAGDLAVAYMVRNNEITARALCWPAKKVFGRVYGDECRLVDLLESASFSSGSLNGARMLRIEEGNGFVVPYIDGCSSAKDCGDHLQIGDGHVCGSNQNGLSGSNLECEACGDSIDEDDCFSDDDGCRYCEHCYHERFGYCERLEETCDRDGMQEVHTTTSSGRSTTQYWGERACDRYATTCDGNGNLYDNDLIVTLEDGTSWSQDYFEDNGFVCDGNGGSYSNDDAVSMDSGETWSQEHFEKHGVTVDGVNYAKGDEPQEDDDATEAQAPVAKPHKASPTVHCDAQLEMPLPVPSFIEQRADGMYYVMNGPDIIDTWATIEFAEECLKEFRANIYRNTTVAS